MSLQRALTISSSQIQSSVYRKIAFRIMPFLMICYAVSYLDRVNISFARMGMVNDLKFSDAIYGLGAGLFFIGYLLFEVPSNLLMMKIGAKKTISRIMILWAIISAELAFVTTPFQFYLVRFLLGVAEAGFYPGIILYLTYWFPSRNRAKMIALFVGAVPIAGMLGAPASGAILQYSHGMAGLAGWQWMFILEAVPAVILGLLCLRFLDDTPDHAAWLSSSEKLAIRQDISAGIEKEKQKSKDSLTKTFTDLRVWKMTALCFCSAICSYGVSFWLPTLVSSLKTLSMMQVGLFSAIPFTGAFIGMYLIGKNSDRTKERRLHLSFVFLLVFLGLIGSVVFHHSVAMSLVALSIAAIGAYSTTSMLFSVTSILFSGIGMVAGVAMINCIGGLGGFVSPYIVGVIKEFTGNITYGIYFISAFSVIGLLLSLTIPASQVNK